MFHHHYKQKCMVCKTNMVLIKSYHQRPVCQECQLKAFSEPITDAKFKKLFNIDMALYEQSPFLRDIRYQYTQYKSLSEKQIEAFKRVVKEIASGKPQERPKIKKAAAEAAIREKKHVWVKL